MENHKKTGNSADVLVCRHVPKTYTYLLPEDQGPFEVGMHVDISFGRGTATGLILKIEHKNDTTKLKPIIGQQEKRPIVPSDLIDLIQWFADYYHISPHKAYQTIIGRTKIRPISSPETVPAPTPSPYSLTPDQQNAIQQILENPTQNHLLYGITSSGKTEVYMQLAAHMINANKGVLMLLPEIALTPQMRHQFKDRFGHIVSVIHSGLTPKEREIQWNRIYTGDAKIVIGPRSAIFSALHNIGLIILDEEHEPSYKQENHPRYHTHTIAKHRAEQHNATLVFGSATPSIHLFQYSEHDPKYTKVSLTKRTNQLPLPKIDVIDMRAGYRDGSHPYFSPQLIQEIKINKTNNEKTLILLNRRGYASYIVCQKCGEVHQCPQCKLSFTYHKDHYFRCHRCDISQALHHTCQSCHSNSLNFGGLGTQRVEVELLKCFPEFKICRLDRDTATSVRALEKTLTEFREEGDILLGTQMVAKGHHFDTVTLVGVLGIDTVLGIPDFRSSERAYQLLSQVAGRAGRGNKVGRVIVQTCQTDHYVIEHAKNHHFDQFYEEEIAYRESLWYPPFSSLINLILSSLSLADLKQYAQKLGHFLQTNKDKFSGRLQVIGPKPAPIEMIRNHHRWNVLIKCEPTKVEPLKSILRHVPPPPKTVRYITDFDPIHIL